MTKEQLIQIAKAGFPEHVQAIGDVNDFTFIQIFGVYRLYEKSTPSIPMSPKTGILSVHINGNDFVQIEARGKAFNHYAAIKEMERMGLIVSL